jgi:TRAP transporter TAXI family solute receptor
MVAAFVMVGVRVAGGAEKKLRIMYGGTSSASGAYAGCVELARVTNKYVPGVNMTIMETGASIENLKLLKRGDCDFGMADFAGSYRAFKGLDEFKGKPNPELRLLWLTVTAFHNIFVTRESGVSSIYELEGKRYGCGLTGSATEAVTLRFFGALDIHPKWFRGATAAARDATKNRQIIGYVKSGCPDSSVQDVAATLPIRLLNITQEELDKANKKYPGLFPGLVSCPAGTYPGQTEPAYSYPIVMYDVTTSALPDDVAYAMINAVYDHVNEMVKAFPVWGWPNSLIAGPEVAVKFATIPLHSAMVRYCKERGFEVPEKLIPPEYKK